MSSSKKTVSFSLESEEQKKLFDQYARDNGFKNVSDIARYSLFAELKRRRLSVSDPDGESVKETQ
jgi:hypothetical protein